MDLRALCNQQKINDAWNTRNTLSWYSSRLAHCTLSICQKLTQCPPHEATKVLLPCCRRNLRQIECIDGIKKILSLAFIATLDSIAVDHRPEDSEKVWPEWVFEFTAGGWAKGIWGRRSVIIRKWEPFDGPGAGCHENSELTWLIFWKKNQMADSKSWIRKNEERQNSIMYNVQYTF